jgi:putative DNA primase/helicase
MLAVAQWCLRALVNRADAHGVYSGAGEASTAKGAVTVRLLEAHLRGEVTVGLHAVAPDGSCRWACIDIDAHDSGKDDAEKIALETYRRLAEAGAEPVLEDSVGGFHIWLFFEEPVASARARALLHAFVPPGVEVFPKQNSVRKGGFGSWVRLPGKHPKLGAWSRFWADGRAWIEWPDGLALFTDSGRCSVALLPAGEPEEHAELNERQRADPIRDEIPEGRRNATLASLAGSMRRRGMTREEIEGAILVANRRRCRPPLDDEEVRRIAESIARYEPDRRTTDGDSENPPGDRAKGNGILPTVIDRDGLTKAIADVILSGYRYARDAGGKLYVYRGGVYRPDGEEQVRRQFKKALLAWKRPKNWSCHHANEVVEYIRVDAPSLWDRPPAHTLNVPNGLLDVERRILRPHDPDFLSSVQLAARFDDAAACPAWERFVEETFPADARALAWEISACLMIPGLLQKKAVLLVGEGDNGKSVYLGALTAFLGKRNVAAVTLHKLEADRFAPARLVGRLANICPDLPSEHLKGTSVFKSITGRDVMEAERKFRDAFEFEPFSRLVFSANHLPRSADASEAFFRRWTVVPFDRRFEPHEQTLRAELDARLAAPQELSGVLNRALVALLGLSAHGYTEAASTAGAWAEFRSTTDPVTVWLEQHTVRAATAAVAKDALYSAYRRHADEAGHPAITKNAFGRQVWQTFPDLDEKQRTVSGRLTWCWISLGLAGQEGGP